MNDKARFLLRFADGRTLFTAGAVAGLVIAVVPGLLYALSLGILVLGRLVTGGFNATIVMDGFLGRGLGIVAAYFTRGLPIIVLLGGLGGCMALINRWSVSKGRIWEITYGGTAAFGLEMPFIVFSIASMALVSGRFQGIILFFIAAFGGFAYYAVWELCHWPLVERNVHIPPEALVRYHIDEMLRTSDSLRASKIQASLGGDGVVKLTGTVPDRSVVSAARSVVMRVQGVREVDTEDLRMG